MKIRYRIESDGWKDEGRKITSEDNLTAIRQNVACSPIIVEHWFYRASTSPRRSIFEEFEEFTVYLEHEACAGDVIYVWNYEEICNIESTIAQGKCPADDGCIPTKGAY